VRIVWDDEHAHGDVPAEPSPKGFGENRGQALVAVLSLVVLIGGLWLAARPDAGFSASNERIVAPLAPNESESDPFSSTTSTPEADTEVDLGGDALAMGGHLHQPVRVLNGWRALRETPNGTELVQSADGLTWASSGTVLPRGDILALSAAGDELSAVIATDLNDEDVVAQVWRSADAGLIWFPDQTTPPVGIDGQIYGGAVDGTGGAINGTAVIVETVEIVPSAQPAEIGDLLSTFLPEELARDTCELRSVFGSNEPGFAFHRCGDTVEKATIYESEISDGVTPEGVWRWQCIELLSFAMRSQGRISVMRADAEPQTVDLPLLMFATDVVIGDNGPMSVLVDYRMFSPLVGPCQPLRAEVASGVYSLDESGNLARSESLPPQHRLDYFGATLTRFGDDGSVLLAGPEGVYVRAAGADAWSQLVERPLGGRIMQASQDGRALMYRTASDEIWLTRTETWLDGDGTWHTVEGADPNEATLLLGNDEGVILTVENLLGVELLQVPLD